VTEPRDPSPAGDGSGSPPAPDPGPPAEPGTYALLLRPTGSGEVRIGALGTLELRPGRYVYVGSAFGPGGLAARVGRHVEHPDTRHWHIDHLLDAVEVVEVLYTLDPRRREEAWARFFRGATGASVPLGSFGAGDCGCEGHLVHLREAPSPEALRAATGTGEVRRWRPAACG
jgi:Uri superfamily endonuclease